MVSWVGETVPPSTLYVLHFFISTMIFLPQDKYDLLNRPVEELTSEERILRKKQLFLKVNASNFTVDIRTNLFSHCIF